MHESGTTGNFGNIVDNRDPRYRLRFLQEGRIEPRLF
jgi:hypothetical protein